MSQCLIRVSLEVKVMPSRLVRHHAWFLGLSAITSVLSEFRSRKLEVIQTFVCLRRAGNLTKRCMSSGKYGKTNYWGGGGIKGKEKLQVLYSSAVALVDCSGTGAGWAKNQWAHSGYADRRAGLPASSPPAITSLYGAAADAEIIAGDCVSLS